MCRRSRKMAAAIGTPIDYEKEGAAAAERGIAPSSPLAGSGWIVANFPSI